MSEFFNRPKSDQEIILSHEKETSALLAEFFSDKRMKKVSQEMKENFFRHFPDRKKIPKDYYNSALRNEKLFSQKIIDSYLRWSATANPLVLWDIDDTIGQRDLEKKSWHFRPIFLEVIDFLKNKFPQIQNGIMSTRLSFDFDNPDELAPMKDYFNLDEIYSSADVDYQDQRGKEIAKESLVWQEEGKIKRGGGSPEFIKKYRLAQDLRSQGKDIKIIDDLDVAKVFGQDGVWVGDCCPSSFFI